MMALSLVAFPVFAAGNMAIPSQRSKFYLVVSKQSNELTLRSFETPSKILKTYRAITGANLGDKEREGDRKTPEGIYFVTRQLPKTRLTKLHGAAAFELNYPNPFDRYARHTGSGIWIHGVDDESRLQKKFDTLGCVAMGNQDVVELGAQLEPGLTPILVVDSDDATKPLGYQSEDSPIVKRVRAWAQAWTSKDQDAYISFYHPDFKSRGMDRKGWDAYKRRLAKQYKTIDVDLGNLTVLKHPKYSVALFRQSYRSDRFRSDSDKILYWVGEGDQAQILIEAVAAENAEILPPGTPVQADTPPAESPASSAGI